MLTIIAWIVFIFASFWNVFFWAVGAMEMVQRNPIDWDRTRVEMIISLAIWIIPGVYLFGLF